MTLHKQTEESWQRAGLADDIGNVGRELASGEISVPKKIVLSDDNQALLIDRYERGRRPHSRSLLNRFVKLWTADIKDIVAFACSWGILSLNDKGRPCCSSFSILSSEPVETWRYFSRRAYAVLNIIAALRQGKIGSLEDWQATTETSKYVPGLIENLQDEWMALSIYASHTYPFGANSDFKRTVDSDRNFIAMEVNVWLRMARIQFTALPSAPEKRWNLFVDIHGSMLSAIALHLAQVLVAADCVFACYGCGTPYARETKRPKSGGANYCSGCGYRAAWRQATQRQRDKISLVLQLHSSGMSVHEIAEDKRVATKPQTVQGWIDKNSNPSHDKALGKTKPAKQKKKA